MLICYYPFFCQLRQDYASLHRRTGKLDCDLPLSSRQPNLQGMSDRPIELGTNEAALLIPPACANLLFCQLFDKVTVIAEGQVLYYGPRAKAQGYFEDLGFVCPKGANVADFLTGVTVEKERVVKDGMEVRLSHVAFLMSFCLLFGWTNIGLSRSPGSSLFSGPYERR